MLLKNITEICVNEDIVDEIVAKLLRTKLKTRKCNQKIKLNDNKRTVIIWKPKFKKALSTNDVLDFSWGSKRKRLNNLKKIRKIFGRKSVDSYMENNVKQKELKMKEYLTVTNITMQQKKNKITTYSTTTAIYINDINLFIQIVAAEHQISRPVVKIGLDGGQGSFKICLTILDEEKIDQEATESVKNVYILFLAFNVQENRHNVKVAWNLLRVDSVFEYIVVVDLKMANILVGLMSHSCKFPCTYCVAKQVNGVYEEFAELRTVGHINNIAKRLKKISVNFDNDDDVDNDEGGTDEDVNFGVVDTPIFDKHHDQLIMTVIRPPPLHLLLGIVNYVLNKLKQLNESLHAKFLKASGVTVNAKGRDVNGNGCRSLLKKYHILDLLGKLHQFQSQTEDIARFVNVFKSINGVVHACFGKNLEDDYLDKIDQLKLLYRKLVWNETPKAHAIFVHLPQYLAYTQRGLSAYSEQAFEAIHHNFKVHHLNYKRDSDHGEFTEKLLSSVASYNSMCLLKK